MYIIIMWFNALTINNYYYNIPYSSHSTTQLVWSDMKVQSLPATLDLQEQSSSCTPSTTRSQLTTSCTGPTVLALKGYILLAHKRKLCVCWWGTSLTLKTLEECPLNEEEIRLKIWRSREKISLRCRLRMATVVTNFSKSLLESS